MVADTSKIRTGRLAKTGKVIGLPNGGGLGVQAGYCTNCDAKQLMTFDEARSFASQFYRQKKRLLIRVVTHILRRLETAR
jgi:hypothetical protein